MEGKFGKQKVEKKQSTRRATRLMTWSRVLSAANWCCGVFMRPCGMIEQFGDGCQSFTVCVWLEGVLECVVSVFYFLLKPAVCGLCLLAAVERKLFNLSFSLLELLGAEAERKRKLVSHLFCNAAAKYSLLYCFCWCSTDYRSCYLKKQKMPPDYFEAQ